jgi:hypothetical protein
MHPFPQTLLHIFSALALLSHLEAAAQKPNVLFIAVDDLNDYVSILDGHPQAKTPNHDRLAKLGMNFTSATHSKPASMQTANHRPERLQAMAASTVNFCKTVITPPDRGKSITASIMRKPTGPN